MNIPDSFSLERPYNLIILFSSIVFFGTLFGFTGDIVPKIPTIIISLGILIIGFGEKLNFIKKNILETYRGNIIHGEGYIREPILFGILLDIFGFLIACFGLYKLFLIN